MAQRRWEEERAWAVVSRAEKKSILRMVLERTPGTQSGWAGAGCQWVVGWGWRGAISAEKNYSVGACRETRSSVLFCHNVYYYFCFHLWA